MGSTPALHRGAEKRAALRDVLAALAAGHPSGRWVYVLVCRDGRRAGERAALRVDKLVGASAPETAGRGGLFGVAEAGDHTRREVVAGGLGHWGRGAEGRGGPHWQHWRRHTNAARGGVGVWGLRWWVGGQHPAPGVVAAHPELCPEHTVCVSPSVSRGSCKASACLVAVLLPPALLKFLMCFPLQSMLSLLLEHVFYCLFVPLCSCKAGASQLLSHYDQLWPPP